MAGKDNKKAKKPGRQALSPAEKEARKAELATEPKTARFVRLGNPRVTKAVKNIRMVGHLAGPGYEYTEAQVEAISKILKNAVAETMEKFNPQEKVSGPALDLGSIV